MLDVLNTRDHLAAIATAIVAVLAWSQYQLSKQAKMRRLEDYLRDTDFHYEEGACSVLHLVAELGLSEMDIMDAAFRNSNIERRRRSDPDTGLTTQVMLRYKRDPPARF